MTTRCVDDVDYDDDVDEVYFFREEKKRAVKKVKKNVVVDG